MYSFCAQSSCTDGLYPIAGLIQDASGNLYGTTEAGGAAELNGGTVFELTVNAAKTAWTHKVLYSFCTQANCADGISPAAGLLGDASGNLYGTTKELGAHGGGTVFELMPNAKKTKWTHKPLYSFCAQGGALCTDGIYPASGLIGDGSGNLYGTTYQGGANPRGGGTVFELTPNAAKTAWTHKVLYSFCPQPGCADGLLSLTGLIADASGNLYGTTSTGGAYDGGTVFELKP